ncbi:glycoside hydrolase family 127 protein, partial [bacterium]|nr:glycoside hydrolase family 127 protein [bacterium]
NGQTVDLNMKKGFACISREWHAGDTVEVLLPMAIRRVVAHEKVITNVGRTALERGPIVFCAEGVDHENNVLNLILSDETSLNAEFEADLLNGVMTVTGQALADGQKIPFKSIPYYAWNHRGVGEMAVWFPRTEKALQEKVDEKVIEKGGERQ